MKKMLACGLAAIAFAAAPVSAQETVSQEAVGWTPIAVGIATPVQLPWGVNMWDVYGLDINLIFSDAPLMYGLNLAGAATFTRTELRGVQASAFGNVALGDVYGVRATIGVNYAWIGETYSWDLGAVGATRKFKGFSSSLLGNYHEEFCGLETGIVGNFVRGEATGGQIAGLANYADNVHGAQLALGVNMTRVLNGAQIALVNYARECPSGFQIGLVNIIIDNKVKVLPFVNGFF